MVVEWLILIGVFVWHGCRSKSWMQDYVLDTAVLMSWMHRKKPLAW